jgi:hypothetical protein
MDVHALTHAWWANDIDNFTFSPDGERIARFDAFGHTSKKALCSSWVRSCHINAVPLLDPFRTSDHELKSTSKYREISPAFTPLGIATLNC